MRIPPGRPEPLQAGLGREARRPNRAVIVRADKQNPARRASLPERIVVPAEAGDVIQVTVAPELRGQSDERHRAAVEFEAVHPMTVLGRGGDDHGVGGEVRVPEINTGVAAREPPKGPQAARPVLAA